MPIHWSYKSIPELAPLSDAERDDIWHTASSRARRRWETWASAIVIALFAAGGAKLGLSFDHLYAGTIAGAALGGLVHERIVFQITRSCLGDDYPRQRKE
jgi:hypothetical protein